MRSPPPRGFLQLTCLRVDRCGARWTSLLNIPSTMTVRHPMRLRSQPGLAPLCDIPSGCCSFTGPWTVTRSSLRMLRWVAAFYRPLRPVLLLVSFPRSRSPVVGVLAPSPSSNRSFKVWGRRVMRCARICSAVGPAGGAPGMQLEKGPGGGGQGLA